jgi:putative endonuclease
MPMTTLLYSADGRPTTIEIGAKNEDRASSFLADLGYVIVERNFKTKLGELDIIARDGDVLVFVEVRSRTTRAFGHAAESVNHTKRARVARMAALYLGWRRPSFAYARFDVLAITARAVDHIVDAWRL